jgi:holliday junction DNA helicase RuvB
MDSRVLRALIEQFGGGPVGLSTLAVAIGEDAGTLEEVYEPFLIQSGFLHRTPRGRMATEKAYRTFGYAPPVDQGRQELLVLPAEPPQQNLFDA